MTLSATSASLSRCQNPKTDIATAPLASCPPLLQVGAANEEQILRKKKMQEREVEEEARIADFNRLKTLREQAIQDEKDRVAAEKEAEVARMRAAQEKAADKQSEIDELRARRHAESAEREWRAREAAKAARDKVRPKRENQENQTREGADLLSVCRQFLFCGLCSPFLLSRGSFVCAGHLGGPLRQPAGPAGCQGGAASKHGAAREGGL